MRTLISRQRGITFLGLVTLGIIVALLALVGFQVVPTVTEYMSIKKVVKKVAADGGSSVAVVKSNFDLVASADYITSITGKDLEVRKEGGEMVIYFAYDKEIHLFGPAYLVIKYEGSSRNAYR